MSRTKIAILIAFFVSLIWQDISAEEKRLYWPDASLIKDCERRIDLINKSIGSKNGYSEDHDDEGSLTWEISKLNYEPHVNCFLVDSLILKRIDLIKKAVVYFSGNKTNWLHLNAMFNIIKQGPQGSIYGREIIESVSSKGNEYATFRLAQLYEDGDQSLGIFQDFQKSFNLYKKVSSFGGRWAKSADLALGMYFEEGIVVPQNYIEALNFYKKSAVAGEPRGMEKLADLYVSGKIQKDLNQAYIFYSLAASSPVYQSGTWAKNIVSKIIIKRDTVAAWLTQKQILEAQKKASLCSSGKYNLCQ